ncbi:LysR family transcriptional regulator [Vibrio sp. V27_P1S3P104]|uniref:LysR family transcriptional regulator n=1 Tax=unclassified Vibrio TaxID=2614977 RepID=UPI0013731F26|nr:MULTISPECIES: LysR family transcriptional regulator [unclassified Vibrio]NAW68319.1 LysR family transcriptional regulator [Vibrio sp. V28_P6S34P95]NAX03955.1 LysR family transcriptional regulator [Vibrio sp. V30_P3S12P165]NAX34741.1 LysR family transcriptional regulator [Vibrio sp. V29_P1S30P107]NAX36827.1 LysR family transcriptional regulator [Vibrio sp. V27_P1S3P104]NAX39637.1 LysR family transcriptional regulator [Vibrio sp. V26_P1S5P106]
MDRLTAAKVFLDVAITQSFTATAERLTMSRPMVTRYIDTMENWLAIRLFNRTTRMVSLTSAGEQCLPEIEAWVQQSEVLLHQTMNKEDLRGKIKLAASMSFGFSQLVPAIKTFLIKHPLVSIDMEVQDKTADLIAERIDLAIRIASNPDPSLIGRKIAECESVLVAAPDYLATQPEITIPQDLVLHRCLGYKSAERHIWHLSQGEQQTSVEVQCAFSANEATALLSAAIYGMGVSLQPTYLVARALANGQLIRLLPDWQPQTMAIYALYPSRKHLAPAVRHLIDHLVAEFLPGESLSKQGIGMDRVWQPLCL